MDVQKTRDRLVEAMLTHVAFDGWTEIALARGAADAGIKLDAGRRAFPEGMAQVVEHFSDYADRLMLAALADEDIDKLPIRARIAAAVRARLTALIPHREAVRRSVAFLALPINAAVAVRCTYRTVDTMWRAAGDRSADFSFYTKRATLAAIYGATVLCWLADTSEGSRETWAFLDRRIDGLMAMRKFGPQAILDRCREFLGGRRPGRGRAA